MRRARIINRPRGGGRRRWRIIPRGQRAPTIAALAALLLADQAPPAGAARAPAAAGRGARAAEPGENLHSDAVISNLLSPTGRMAFLLLPRTAELTEEAVGRHATRLAEAIGATARIREGGGVVVVLLEHKDRRIAVHRLGPALRVSAADPLTLPEPLRGIIGAVARPEGDYDQELLLRARDHFADPEHRVPGLVSLAQGGAARGLLLRFVTGDDVGAVLFGQRHAPLLMGHPDTRLLRAVLGAAERALEIELPPLPPPPGAAGDPDAGPATATTPKVKEDHP